MERGREAATEPHKILPKGSQKREPKPCQKGVNFEALPEQTDSKKVEQNTNKTPTKNSIFLVGKPSFEARGKLGNSGGLGF